jgi:hypothetical protein
MREADVAVAGRLVLETLPAKLAGDFTLWACTCYIGEEVVYSTYIYTIWHIVL